MKHVKHPTLTAMAMSVSLACGSAAMADEKPDAYGASNGPQASGHMTPDEASNANRRYDASMPNENPVDAQTVDSDDNNANIATRDAAGFLEESVTTENDIGEFAAAIEKAGLGKALTNGTEYTIFAPTDAAFAAYQADNAELDAAQLRELLRSHIVAGKVDAEQVAKLDSAEVLTGDKVRISKADGDKVEIGDAGIVTADIRAGDLTIHTIDAVLAPDSDEDSSARTDGQESAREHEEFLDQSPDEEEAE